MRALDGLPSVAAKVLGVVAIVTGITTICIGTLAGAYLFAERRAQRADVIQSQARVVAMNSSAALAFGDHEMATAALRALQVVEGIRHASLRDADGVVVARFDADGAGPVPVRQEQPGLWEVRDGYSLVLPVGDQAGMHGQLQVDYRDQGYWSLALRTLAQALALFALAMGLAWWLARRLLPVLVAPVQELERATRDVRETGDYGIRARRVSDDELGRLTDDFNAMLEDIGANQLALQRAQREAEEASRLKDEFVATVSHELRTPLSPIVAWLQLLRLPTGAAQLPQALDVMERNARALTRIIDDLLDMSRIVSGTMRLDLRPQQLDPCLLAAVDTVAPAAQARHVTLAVALATPTPTVRVDPPRLQQIVWNLLSNAVKFTPPGGRVDVSSHLEDDRVRIEVADTGTGIAPDFLPFVFDRFRQQDGSTTRAHSGLGLGLAIVRQLVELQGGSVLAESAGLGAGARFTVWLPRVDEAAARAACGGESAPRRDGTRLDGLDVLVIEDEPDMLRLIDTILAQAGARTQVAGDAAEAVARFSAHRPDIVVSDIGLPGVDGYALLAQLRALAPGPVRAVALTAYARADERRRAFDAGYHAHLSKPVNPDDLVQTVARVAAEAPPGGAGSGTRAAPV